MSYICFTPDQIEFLQQYAGVRIEECLSEIQIFNDRAEKAEAEVERLQTEIETGKVRYDRKKD